MDNSIITKLEARIYAFSVNVYSFVKSLEDKNLSIQDTKELLIAANSLYSSYFDVMDIIDKDESKPDFSDCIKMAEKGASFLQKFELKGALLNEKVDLAIEINDILRKLKSL